MERRMIEAVVQVGELEITYRRAGAGQRVLLLERGDDFEWEWLFARLSQWFRVVAAVAPVRDTSGQGTATPLPEVWLRGIIDGLGLDRPAIVTGADMAAAVLRFAALDPGRAERVAVIVGPGQELASPRDPPHPVLALRLPPASDPAARERVAAELADFLGRASAGGDPAHGPSRPQPAGAIRSSS